MSKYVNNKNAYRPNARHNKYQQVIEEIQRQNECPFCPENLSKYHKKPILIDSASWLVTKNMYPYAGSKNHLLIIHKKHLDNLADVTEAGWKDLKRVIELSASKLKIKGATLILRFGDTNYTGASVSHLHAQLVSGSDKPENPPILARVGNQ